MRILNLNDVAESTGTQDGEESDKGKTSLLSTANWLYIFVCTAIALSAITLLIYYVLHINPLTNPFYWLGCAMVALIVIPDVVEGKSSLQIFKKLGMCLLPAILIYMVANSVWGIDIGKKPKDGGKPAVRTVTNIQQPINSATQTITGKVLNIELKPGEVYDVDNIRGEQQWRFLAFNGAFDHRVDKGDGRACWKQVTNTKPWKADWNGKLQLRAGNTPVTITVNVL